MQWNLQFHDIEFLVFPKLGQTEYNIQGYGLESGFKVQGSNWDTWLVRDIYFPWKSFSSIFSQSYSHFCNEINLDLFLLTITTFKVNKMKSNAIATCFQREYCLLQERCILDGTLTVNYDQVDVDYRLKHNDLLANIVHRYEPISNNITWQYFFPNNIPGQKILCIFASELTLTFYTYHTAIWQCNNERKHISTFAFLAISKAQWDSETIH